MNDIDETLGALADPTRRRVVEILGAGPHRAGDLAAGVGVAATSLTRHLQVLRTSGLVTVETLEDDARGRVYALNHDRLAAMQAWLDQVQAFWTDELEGFKDHVGNVTRAWSGKGRRVRP